MGLKFLDHVNVCTRQVEVLRTFYADVLGLPPGPRPGFSFNGAWMYCGPRPAVHLVERLDLNPTAGDLRVQHFAFAAEGLAEFVERLKAKGVPFRVGILEDFGLCQVNVHDPDGNHIHIDFPLAEARAIDLNRGNYPSP
jgi:catechol 2,3-dioxygenase-like lactoylglutathione lyase family enzyme